MYGIREEKKKEERKEKMQRAKKGGGRIAPTLPFTGHWCALPLVKKRFNSRPHIIIVGYVSKIGSAPYSA